MAQIDSLLSTIRLYPFNLKVKWIIVQILKCIDLFCSFVLQLSFKNMELTPYIFLYQLEHLCVKLSFIGFQFDFLLNSLGIQDSIMRQNE